MLRGKNGEFANSINTITEKETRLKKLTTERLQITISFIYEHIQKLRFIPLHWKCSSNISQYAYRGGP